MIFAGASSHTQATGREQGMPQPVTSRGRGVLRILMGIRAAWRVGRTGVLAAASPPATFTMERGLVSVASWYPHYGRRARVDKVARDIFPEHQPKKSASMAPT